MALKMFCIVALIGSLLLQLAVANACNGDCNCSATIINCKCQKGGDFIKPKNFSATIPANITTLIVSNCNRVILDKFTFLNTNIETLVVKRSNEVLVKSNTFTKAHKVDSIRFKNVNLTFEENAFNLEGKSLNELVLHSVQCEKLDKSILNYINLRYVKILNSNLKAFNMSQGRINMRELLISNSTLDEIIISHQYSSGSIQSLKILNSNIKRLRKRGILLSASIQVQYVLLDSNTIGLLENEFLTIWATVVHKFSFTNNLVEYAEDGVFDSADNLLHNIQIENNVFQTGPKRHWKHLFNGHMSISNNTFPCTFELCYELNETYPVFSQNDFLTHFDNIVYNNSKCLGKPLLTPFEVYGPLSDVVECLAKFNKQPDLQPNQTCMDGCVCNSREEAICNCQSSETFTPQLKTLSSTIRNVIVHNCTTVVLEKSSIGQTRIESLIVRDVGEIVVLEGAFSSALRITTIKFKNTTVTLNPMAFQTYNFLSKIIFDQVNFKNLTTNAFSMIYHVDKVKILNSKIDTIKKSFFGNSTVWRYLLVANTVIDSIETEGLRIETYGSIYLINNTIGVMAFRSIDIKGKAYSKIILTLKGNKIGQIKTKALSITFPGVDQLNFVENSVEKLDKDVFSELYRISAENLTIAGNTFQWMEEQSIDREDAGLVVEGNKIACNAQFCTHMKHLFPSMEVESRPFFRNLVYKGATCVSDNRAIDGKKVVDLYGEFIDSEDCENLLL